MGNRGPAPTPTKLRVLRGETRPSRLNKTEPKPEAGPPTQPEGMSAESRVVWDRIIVTFGATGVLAAVDADALRLYCEAMARYEKAADLLERSGPVVKGARGGELVKNPLHQVVRDNAALARSMARELGLTPAARANLHVGTSNDESDPLAKWLAMPTGSPPPTPPRPRRAKPTGPADALSDWEAG